MSKIESAILKVSGYHLLEDTVYGFDYAAYPPI